MKDTIKGVGAAAGPSPPACPPYMQPPSGGASGEAIFNKSSDELKEIIRLNKARDGEAGGLSAVDGRYPGNTHMASPPIKHGRGHT